MSPQLGEINRLVCMQGQGGSRQHKTPSPCSGSPCPLRPQGRWLPAQGDLRAASPVGAIFQARVQAGARETDSLVGKAGHDVTVGARVLGPLADCLRKGQACGGWLVSGRGS